MQYFSDANVDVESTDAKMMLCMKNIKLYGTFL